MLASYNQIQLVSKPPSGTPTVQRRRLLVNFRAVEYAGDDERQIAAGAVVGSSRDKHRAVIQQRRSVGRTRPKKAARSAEASTGWIEYFRRAFYRRGGRISAHYQHSSVIEQSGCMLLARRRHRAGRREGSSSGVVQFRRG